TLAEHVARELADLILDAGPTSGGLESTVLDVTTSPPRQLRPGLVTVARFEALVGPIERGTAREGAPLRAPGLLERRYAPRTPLQVVSGSRVLVEDLHGLRVGWLTHLDESAPASVLR